MFISDFYSFHIFFLRTIRHSNIIPTIHATRITSPVMTDGSLMLVPLKRTFLSDTAGKVIGNILAKYCKGSGIPSNGQELPVKDS